MTKRRITLAKRKKVVNLNKFKFNHVLNMIVEHTKKTHVIPHFLLVQITIKRHIVLDTWNDPISMTSIGTKFSHPIEINVWHILEHVKKKDAQIFKI